MQNRDIIVVGLQPWDIEIGSNCKNIALELSKQNRVLYVNRALDRVTAYKQRHDPKTKARMQSISGKAPDLEQVQENLWTLNPRTILESVNWMPSFLFTYFNKRNNQKLADRIRDAADRLQFKNIVLFIDNDFFRAFHLKEMLNAKLTIYYIRDYLVDQPYFKKHGAELEKNLMAKADVVTANSPYLADYGREHNPHSYYIGQGCDFDLFQNENYPMPEDLHQLKRPVIGYVGALVGFRLDIELIVSIAKAKPDWNIVLVGPEDEAFRNSALHQLPNVYFPGRKNAADLPAYIAHFDVCINPQAINNATLGNYPRKVDEYLALGKPVVATATPFMKLFEEHTYLCEGSEAYISAIQMAIAEDDPAKAAARKAFALSHTWENSVKELYRACTLAMQQQKEIPAYG